MRGREAIRSAQRREHETTEKLAAIRSELETERKAHRRRVVELEGEIRRLHSEHEAEAATIAAKEVKRLLDKNAEERRAKGLSDDIVINFMYQKDKLIMNACRYLSMTKGQPPGVVFPLVMAWATDKDFYGFTRPIDFFIEIGVPMDGWVARNLARVDLQWQRHVARRNRKLNEPDAISLDHAVEQGHKEIHPRYRESWYPPVTYDIDIELVEDDHEAAP